MHYLKLITVLLLILATAWQVALIVKVCKKVRSKWIFTGLLLALGASAILTFRRALNINLSELWMMVFLSLYGLGWNIIGMWVYGMINGHKKRKK